MLHVFKIFFGYFLVIKKAADNFHELQFIMSKAIMLTILAFKDAPEVL